MKLLKLTSTIALALLLTNCQKEETNDTIDTHVPILFSSNTVTVEKAEGAQTRANFEVDDKFQIIVKDNTASPFTDKTFAGTAGVFDGTTNPITVDPILYWDDVKGRAANLMFLGIRKNYGTGDLTNKTVTDNKIGWTIAADQSGGLDTYDLITAKTSPYTFNDRFKEDGTTPNPVKLDFEHRLTKVTVVIVPGSETGAYKVEETPGATNDLCNATVKFKLPVDGAKYDLVEKKLFYGTPDYTDEAPVATNISEDVVTSQSAYNVEESGVDVLKGYSFTVLAYPYTIAAGASLAKITIDGNVYDVVISSTDDTPLAQGKHNTYIVTVRKSGISIVAGLTDWDSLNGVDLNTRLVTPGDITITGTTGSPLSNGAEMTMRVTGTSDPTDHIGKFTYDADESGTPKKPKWDVVSGTEVYWDDVVRPVTKVEAFLNTNPAVTGNAAGEYYFTGVQEFNSPAQDVAPSIALGTGQDPFFKRPLCKIDIIVKTSAAREPDRVNIEGVVTDSATDDGIQSITILGCGDFGVTDDVKVTRVGTGNLVFTGGKYNDDNHAEAALKDTYTCDPFYILPYESSITKIAEVVIREKDGDGYVNTYPVNLPTATTLEAGKHYTYTVTIKKTGVSITGTLTDWVPVIHNDIETGL